MKKTIVILCAMALIFTLVACSQNEMESVDTSIKAEDTSTKTENWEYEIIRYREDYELSKGSFIRRTDSSGKYTELDGELEEAVTKDMNEMAKYGWEVLDCEFVILYDSNDDVYYVTYRRQK